jgi:hypothetical protein
VASDSGIETLRVLPSSGTSNLAASELELAGRICLYLPIPPQKQKAHETQPPFFTVTGPWAIPKRFRLLRRSGKVLPQSAQNARAIQRSFVACRITRNAA